MRLLLLAGVTAAAFAVPATPAVAACDERPEVCEPAEEAHREAADADDDARESTKRLVDRLDPPPLPVAPFCNAVLSHGQRRNGAALAVYLSFEIAVAGDCHPSNSAACFVDATGANVGGAADRDDDSDCLASATTNETPNAGDMLLVGLVVSPGAARSAAKHVSAVCFTVDSCQEAVTGP